MSETTRDIVTRINDAMMDVIRSADTLERAWSLRSTPAADVVKAEDDLITKVRIWRNACMGMA